MAIEAANQTRIVADLKVLAFNSSGDGVKLPGENVLARQYGVSRVTARRALQKMVSLGLAEARPGKGTYTTRQGHATGASTMRNTTQSQRTQRPARMVEAAPTTAATRPATAPARVPQSTETTASSPQVRPISQMLRGAGFRRCTVDTIARLTAMGAPAKEGDLLPCRCGQKAIYMDGAWQLHQPRVPLPLFIEPQYTIEWEEEAA